MSTSINRVTLCGRLGKDPDVRTLENGTKVANFSLATGGEKYTNKEGREIEVPTQWHNIVCWRSLAELSEKYLKKGQAVTIFGEINYRKYTDKDNVERITTDIVATDLFFGSSAQGDKAQSDYQQAAAPATAPAPQAAPALFPPQQNGQSDDLPF